MRHELGREARVREDLGEDRRHNLKHGKPTEYDWDWPEETVVRRRSARRSIGRRGAAELEVGEAGGGVV